MKSKGKYKPLPKLTEKEALEQIRRELQMQSDMDKFEEAMNKSKSTKCRKANKEE